MNEKIETLMKNLGITEEEAKEIVEEDKRIDRGEKLYSLDKEAEQASKKARSTTKGEKKPVIASKSKKEKAANTDKANLLGKMIGGLGVDVVVANPEREFSFEYNGVKYKVVLSCPRS